MMPFEHYLEAEEILQNVKHIPMSPEAVDRAIARAQVHAILATVIPGETADPEKASAYHAEMQRLRAEGKT